MTSKSCSCSHGSREAVVVALVILLTAAVLVFLGVALLGIHLCGDEVAAVAGLLRHDVGVVVASVSNTFKGGLK